MALPQPADRGIAGHRTDGRKSVCDQCRPDPHARSGGRGFTAGVAAADNDDIELICSGIHAATSIVELKIPEAVCSILFHVKPPIHHNRVSRETAGAREPRFT
jgi:hypothetical protein